MSAIGQKQLDSHKELQSLSEFSLYDIAPFLHHRKCFKQKIMSSFLVQQWRRNSGVLQPGGGAQVRLRVLPLQRGQEESLEPPARCKTHGTAEG